MPAENEISNLLSSTQTAVIPSTSSDTDSDLYNKLSKLIESKFSSELKKIDDTISVRFNKIESSLTGMRNDLDIIKSNYSAQLSDLKQGRDNGEISQEEFEDRRYSILNDKIDLSIQSFEARESKHVKLTQYMLTQLSMVEQRNRLWSVRIHCFQDPTTPTNKITDEHVYNKIIEPSLRQAIRSGLIQNFDTSFDYNVEYSHPLPKNRGPPQFIYRFFSRRVLYAFMTHKKSVIDAHIKGCYNNRRLAPGATPYNKALKLKASHDLSGLNRQTMTYLYESGLVDACKIQGLGVSFKPKGETKWYRVQNPYGSDLYNMVQPPPPLHEIVPDALAHQSDLFRLAFEMDKEAKTDLKKFFSDVQLDLQQLRTAAKLTTSSRMQPEPEPQKNADSQSPAQMDPDNDDYPPLPIQPKTGKKKGAASRATIDGDSSTPGTSAASQNRDQPDRNAKIKKTCIKS